MANAWGDAWGGDTGAWLTAWGVTASPVVVCSGNTVGSELDSQTNATDGLSQSLGNGTIEQVSQSFEAGDWSVGGFCLKLLRVGTPTGTVVASIRAHTGTLGTSSTPTGGNLIASASLDIAAVNNGAWTRYWFPFSSELALTSGTAYTMVLDGSGITGDGSNRIYVGADDGGDAVHAGNLATYNGSTWTAQSSQDFEFSLYGNTGDDGSIRFRGAFNRRRLSWGG